MPQMANSALSEDWLLKEIGDIHWELLSKLFHHGFVKDAAGVFILSAVWLLLGVANVCYGIDFCMTEEKVGVFVPGYYCTPGF